MTEELFLFYKEVTDELYRLAGLCQGGAINATDVVDRVIHDGRQEGLLMAVNVATNALLKRGGKP